MSVTIFCIRLSIEPIKVKVLTLIFYSPSQQIMDKGKEFVL